MASYSMVALSVSISAITSPDLTLSPSFLSHLARLPFSIVGDSAGMRMLVGIAGPTGNKRPSPPRRFRPPTEAPVFRDWRHKASARLSPTRAPPERRDNQRLSP